MNAFVLVSAVLLGVALAEPPRFNNRFLSRQEAAPYPPSGWKPSGAEFRLPERQQAPPQNNYGAPKPTYGPPKPSYGPPPEYGPPAEATTANPDAENVTTEGTDTETTTLSRLQAGTRPQKQSEKLQEERGIYYIYHPNGYLQKVTFATKNDIQNMIYNAQIKYQDVEPIRDPIYTIDAATGQYVRVDA